MNVHDKPFDTHFVYQIAYFVFQRVRKQYGRTYGALAKTGGTALVNRKPSAGDGEVRSPRRPT
jgi:hypothetical protein